MNQRDVALASLWGRTYRAGFTSDPRMLLDATALGDARQLMAATDPVTDIPAAHVLGWFCWLRYLALPSHDAEQELSAAVDLLKPVFELNPYAVPEPLQRWYLQAEASSYINHYSSASADWARPGLRPWRGAARLPVFHAAVRSTIDAAPVNQPDRARFLLNAALMLRSTAGRTADEAVLAETAEITLAALGADPIAVRPPTDVRSSFTPYAFLEPVGGPAAAAKFIQPPRQARAALASRPAADPRILPSDWPTDSASALRRPADWDEPIRRTAPMTGAYSESRLAIEHGLDASPETDTAASPSQAAPAARHRARERVVRRRRLRSRDKGDEFQPDDGVSDEGYWPVDKLLPRERLAHPMRRSRQARWPGLARRRPAPVHGAVGRSVRRAARTGHAWAAGITPATPT